MGLVLKLLVYEVECCWGKEKEDGGGIGYRVKVGLERDGVGMEKGEGKWGLLVGLVVVVDGYLGVLRGVGVWGGCEEVVRGDRDKGRGNEWGVWVRLREWVRVCIGVELEVEVLNGVCVMGEGEGDEVGVMWD